MIALTRPITLAVLISIGVVSIWTPLIHAGIAARWFSFPDLFFLAPVPLLVLVAVWAMLRVLNRAPNAAPFCLALLLLFFGYSRLALSLWPYIIPPNISIRDAAPPPQS